MSTFKLADGAPCDLNALVDTRLLIQANSGGGKSWCLRRVLEQTHGRVQHLVIDPEGEFASLRERFDYVLAARHGGDTSADPRAAKLLAERLLELGVSAILDIYELKAHDRVRFVRYFIEALVDAPKKLWHPALVVVDEAHVYCPQQGEAESAPAVIDLATRGRKRGFCAVLATQRLSKLHKDAAAELNNKLIGRTGLDVDVKRAADELGFGKERWRELRELPAGHFFAFGPAISREVRPITVGPITTTHPKAGARLAFTAPPPTDKVRALLPKLADLPAEAEQRQRTNDELKADITRLTRELRQATEGRAAGKPTGKPEDKAQVRQQAGVIRSLRKALEAAMKFIVTVSAQGFDVPGVDRAELERAIQAAVGRAVQMMDGRLEARSKAIERLREQAAALAKAINAAVEDPDVELSIEVTKNEPFTVGSPGYYDRTVVQPAGRLVRAIAARSAAQPPAEGLTGPQQAILDTVAMLGVRGIGPERDTVARWLGIHPNGGSYGTNLGFLRAEGYLEGFQLTDKGQAAARAQETGLEAALAALDAEPKRNIIRVLVDAGKALSREELADKLGLHPNGGSYGTNLGWLRTMGVITERGPITFTEGLMR